MVIIQLPGFKKSNHFPGPAGHRVTISTASSTSTEVISVGSPVLEPRHDNGTAPGSLGSPLNWHWIMKDGLGMFLRNFQFKSKRMQYKSIIYIYMYIYNMYIKNCVYIYKYIYIYIYMYILSVYIYIYSNPQPTTAATFCWTQVWLCCSRISPTDIHGLDTLNILNHDLYCGGVFRYLEIRPIPSLIPPNLVGGFNPSEKLL